MKTIAECVRDIAAHPAELAPRLDLADCFQRQRKPELARWVRKSLARGEALAPIGCTIPTLTVWGNVRYSSYIHANDPYPPARWEAWERVGPGHWRAPQHLQFSDYYGRLVISCEATSWPSTRLAADELGAMPWLETLYNDGLLELIEYNIGAAETVDWAFEWPAAIRSLPFSLNTARAIGDDFGVKRSRRFFAWPSLVGLYLRTGTFPKAVTAELPRLAPGLQFLSIDTERRTTELDALIEAIPSFPRLRWLAVLGSIRLTDANLAALARPSAVSALGVNTTHLTRAGLFALGANPTLRWLGISSLSVSRADLAAFRREFPRVHLFLSDDMQTRLGPA